MVRRLLLGLALTAQAACSYQTDYHQLPATETGGVGDDDGRSEPPDPELCNERDDDGDGDIDETYAKDRPCELAGGCPGVTACREDGLGVGCTPDSARVSTEVCDGRDNDCDGMVDYRLGDARVISACDCVEQRGSFAGVAPADEPASASDECPTTECERDQAELEMTFCVDPQLRPYAMCEAWSTLDLTQFLTQQQALSVRFSFDSEVSAQAHVNLYYEIERELGDEIVAVRRYFPLLQTGDPPGDYRRTFVADHACFAQTEGTLCHGEQESCADCRLGATCGVATGDDCGELDFSSARLQLAVEDGPERSLRGKLRIHELSFGQLACLGPATD